MFLPFNRPPPPPRGLITWIPLVHALSLIYVSALVFHYTHACISTRRNFWERVYVCIVWYAGKMSRFEKARVWRMESFLEKGAVCVYAGVIFRGRMRVSVIWWYIETSIGKFGKFWKWGYARVWMIFLYMDEYCGMVDQQHYIKMLYIGIRIGNKSSVHTILRDEVSQRKSCSRRWVCIIRGSEWPRNGPMTCGDFIPLDV